jgi:hypothetical protein
MRVIVGTTALIFAVAAHAADIGQIKSAAGTVHIERDGKVIAAPIGSGVKQSDKLVTGADGTIGVTFLDNSLISAGPNSVLVLDRYNYNPTTAAGRFDASLKKGTIAVVSGKMVKQKAESMQIRTPSTVMGVRGTEFVVRVDDSGS